ncbi:unnamed protein product [Thelazia callipaeda]|uniref:DUF3825 domain-containing protein n=1 Tax=Thelazia callipaeda TaxID=103827 RepID=A0A0N5CTW2_THECL|nr:unnamed protein product [Thelazia callipaeda]
MRDYLTKEVDIPYIRRNYENKRKIYRNCRGLVSPILIYKCFFKKDSDEEAQFFVAKDGKLTNINNNSNLLAEDFFQYAKKPCPCLKAADRIAFDRFDIPYSVNKRGRWKLYDKFRENLKNLQVI